jgi:hypothetical protein
MIFGLKSYSKIERRKNVMTHKGLVSTVDNTKKTARVILSELNNNVSRELSIAHYVGELKINDVVVIDFYEGQQDGLIVANLSNNSIIPIAPGDNDTYTHTQLSPTNVWNINHNLNKMPSITIVDSADNLVFGEIKYISANEIIVSFSAAFAGKAYLN